MHPAGVRRLFTPHAVYGAADWGLQTEESETNPQTAYAHCSLSGARFPARKRFPVFLRNAIPTRAALRMHDCTTI
jgi:hypothetical protein